MGEPYAIGSKLVKECYGHRSADARPECETCADVAACSLITLRDVLGAKVRIIG